MWRSLVARLNGVQEAGSSNLLTQTTQEHRDSCHGVPRFVGGEKTMTTRDAHVRSPRLSPVSFAVDAPLRSVGFPTFRLTPPQFSRPFAIPSLRSLQIFSPRPERRGLNSSATLSYEIIAHSFRRSAYMPDRNNANPPQSNSFRRFCAVETCQYVYYCLRSARTKSSENLFLLGASSSAPLL